MSYGLGVGKVDGKRVVRVSFGQLPHPVLYPNALRRLHWRQRARSSKLAREEALLIAKANIPQYLRDKPIERAEVEIVFSSKTRRTRDIDGLISACKPWLDGLVDAGVMVKDDGWHIIKLTGCLVKEDEENTVIRVLEV